MAWRAALSRNLREIRVMCCPKSETSKGARHFFESSYRELKMLNPNLPILIRMGLDTEARVLGLYGRGVERVLSIEGMSSQDIETQVKELAVGQVAADALLHAEWRTLIDTSPPFGLFMQLNGQDGLWEKVKEQDFLGILSAEMNRSGISEEQKDILSLWNALTPARQSEYASPGLRAFCKEQSAAGAARSALFEQWQALPAAQQQAYDAKQAVADGLRYFKVASEADIASRRRVAGEPEDAEAAFIREKWDALSGAERAEFEARAASGAPMRDYPVVPPFWQQ